jgi:hypothetical protein
MSPSKKTSNPSNESRKGSPGMGEHFMDSFEGLDIFLLGLIWAR